MHQLVYLSHDFHRAGSATYETGPQAAEIKVAKLRVVQLGNEHSRHAIERRTALLLHCLERGQRGKVLPRDHHSSAVTGAGQVGQHHAKAVIERHRDADPVRAAKPHCLSYEIRVVENIVVGKRSPLWQAGSPGRVLDVHHIIRIKGSLPLRQFLLRDIATKLHELLPGERPAMGRIPHEYHVPHEGQLVRPYLTCLRLPGLGTNLIKHRDIIRGLEALDQHQSPHPGVTQSMLQLMSPIGGVDIDQHGSYHGRGKLDDHPFRVVCSPDGDPVTLFHPQAYEAFGSSSTGLLEFPVCISAAAGDIDQGLVVRIPVGDLVKEVRYGRSQQRGFRATMGITQLP